MVAPIGPGARTLANGGDASYLDRFELQHFDPEQTMADGPRSA